MKDTKSYIFCFAYYTTIQIFLFHFYQNSRYKMFFFETHTITYIFHILLALIFDLIYRNEFDNLWIIKKLVTKWYAILFSTIEYSMLYYIKHNMF